MGSDSRLLSGLDSIRFSGCKLRVLRIVTGSRLLLTTCLAPCGSVGGRIRFDLRATTSTILRLVRSRGRVDRLRDLGVAGFSVVVLVAIVMSGYCDCSFCRETLGSVKRSILGAGGGFSSMS